LTRADVGAHARKLSAGRQVEYAGRRVGCHTARRSPQSGVPIEREASAGFHVRASSWSSKKSEPWFEGRSSGSRIHRPPCLPGLTTSGVLRRSYPVTATGSRRILTGFPQIAPAPRWRRPDPPADEIGGSPSYSNVDAFYRRGVASVKPARFVVAGPGAGASVVPGPGGCLSLRRGLGGPHRRCGG